MQASRAAVASRVASEISFDFWIARVRLGLFMDHDVHEDIPKHMSITPYEMWLDGWSTSRAIERILQARDHV